MRGPDRPTVVVGGGVRGLAVAAAASVRGRRVVVLEREPGLCAVASAASFAWANARAKAPAHYAEMNRRGIARHAEMSDAAGPDRGWYHALRGQPRGDAALPSRIDEGGWVDVLAYAAAARSTVERAGGAVRTGVEAAVVAGGDDPAVTTATGESIAAEVVVVAAGAATARLLSGSTPAVVGDAAGAEGFVVRARAEHRAFVVSDALSARPDGPGRVVLQSVALERRLAEAGTAITSASVWPALREIAGDHGVDLADDALVEVRAAVRPTAIDGLPVAGWIDPGRYLLLAHSGITLAPVLGELVASELDGDPRTDLSPFRPGRIPQPATPGDHP